MIEDAYVGHNTPILADVSDARDDARARAPPPPLSPRAPRSYVRALSSRARAKVIYCAIADFRAGSYDAGLFLDTIARAGHGGLSYNAVANVSRDANGDAYTVQCVLPTSRTASRKVRSEPVRVSEHRARARARSSSSPLARN